VAARTVGVLREGLAVRVDQTNLRSAIGDPNISYGSSTAFAQVPTLVWPISGTGVHITVYPDDGWKFSQMQAQSELEERRQQALKADDDEALDLIRGWRSEGKSNDVRVRPLAGEAASRHRSDHVRRVARHQFDRFGVLQRPG
jgi:hypothetical protein